MNEHKPELTMEFFSLSLFYIGFIASGGVAADSNSTNEPPNPPEITTAQTKVAHGPLTTSSPNDDVTSIASTVTSVSSLITSPPGQPNGQFVSSLPTQMDRPYWTLSLSTSQAPSSSSSEPPSNINLLRKLWSSTRTTAINLTEQHRSILRIDATVNKSHHPTEKLWEDLKDEYSSGKTSYNNKEGQVVQTFPIQHHHPSEDRTHSRSSLYNSPHNVINHKPVMVTPEWLSSGGVYPDDNGNNTLPDLMYNGDPEYDALIGLQRSEMVGEEAADVQKVPVVHKRVQDGEKAVSDMGLGHPGLYLNQYGLNSDTTTTTTTVTPVAQSELFQSGLADVISRGRIDSVMYVYFGEKLADYHKEQVAGRIIQVSWFPCRIF